MQKFASAAQLAERYHVDASTIWRWVQRDILPAPLKISPGCSRFDIEAADKQIVERESPRKDVTRAVEASLRSEKRRKAKAA